ncbi:MAG: GTPase ObgE [Nanoarchaeota archaeon]|nr:GTPase ObgE [Nanoarchaeota archaeon]
MLIDEVKIKIHSGNGGKGAVAFNKNMMTLGPTGGSGGKGADIYFEGVPDIGRLDRFRYEKSLEAENGEDGRSQFRDGRDGKDLILQVPVGTEIRDLQTKEVWEITRIGERLMLVKGGRGGKGNFLFRSSKNTSPRESQPGLPGEKRKLFLELKLIADVGLIGFPNAGKSSLLNALTNAKSKVANYAFTTLEPNLGAWHDLILADIPGLIEGAHEGRGLGTKFLRHIERTSVLFHLVSSESENPFEDYKTIRRELGKYSPELLKKKELVFLSKSDEKTEKEIERAVNMLRKKKLSPLPLSILDEASMKKVERMLNEIQKEKQIS